MEEPCAFLHRDVEIRAMIFRGQKVIIVLDGAAVYMYQRAGKDPNKTKKIKCPASVN